jgi:hypothetical protein
MDLIKIIDKLDLKISVLKFLVTTYSENHNFK